MSKRPFKNSVVGKTSTHKNSLLLNVMADDQIIIYQAPDGERSIEVKIDSETLWLRQSQIAELFKRERTVVTKHLTNLFKEGELAEKSYVQKMHIANSDRPVTYYSLDVVFP